MLLFSADCSLFSLTMDDLQYSSDGKAEVVYICDKPLDVPPDIDLWAYDEMTGRLVTAENPSELRYFASVAADVLFEYDPDAPASSVLKMPARFGLVCRKSKPAFPNSARILPEASFGFSLRQPCPAGVAEVGPVDPRWLAEPGKPPCNPQVQAKKKKEHLRVPVCVRPKGISKNVSEWAKNTDGQGNVLTFDPTKFTMATANAEISFVYDPNASPESVYWFVKNPGELSCPGKLAPRPYDQVQVADVLPVWAALDSLGAEMRSGAGGQGTGKTPPKSNPEGKGDGQTSWTSSKDGKGPPLSALEAAVRQWALAGALASGDVSGDPKNPNGARYGNPNGTSADGPDSIILQGVAGTLAIVTNPIKTSRRFIEVIREGLINGKAVFIMDPKVLSKELAEKLATEPEKELTAAEVDLAESFGKAMAPSLREAGAIMPYSRTQIFTRGWGGDYQAHHILEVAMAEKTLKMDAKAIADTPAIILTEAEHKAITKKLNDARKKIMEGAGKTAEDPPTPQQLWAIYQEAYKGYPNLLDAIKGYFPHVP